MNKILCVIRDLKADSYGAPCLFGGPKEAVRSFCDLLEDKQTLVGRHPQDFQLVHIADWDEISGVVTPVEHVIIVDGATYTSAN